MESNANKTAEISTRPRGLGAFVDLLSKVVNPVIKYAVIVSAGAVAVMMFLTFVSVSGRITADFPIKGYFEIVEYCMVLMTIFGVGYTALSKGHVRVDIISNYASRRVNAALDVFAYGICFVFYCFITWQGFLNGLTNMEDKITSGVLHIPVYPFNFLLVIGTALLALVFLRDFLKSIDEVRK